MAPRDVPPPPDLSRKIEKDSDQHVAGGAFGDVYRCQYNGGSKQKEVVAVKALRISLDEDTADRFDKMLRRELGIWRRLSHENIVPFLGIAYGFGRRGTMSLVSLWMPNECLRKFLTMHNDILDTTHRLQILLDVARGLHYLHSSRIVHGDLYPNNVLLDADYTARLTDFGYASLVGNGPEAMAYLQRSTARPGALRWAAPELLGLEETFHLSTECDIYSFGCIALQVLSGKQPWSEVRADMAVITLLAKGQKPGSPESLKMDESLWDFVQHCWLSPQDRPAADNLIASLEQFTEDYGPLSGPLRDLFISPTSGVDSQVDKSLTPLSIRHRITSVVSKSTKTYRPDPNDFILLVMGPTGSGKTNFINHLTGKVETGNARNLKSDTNVTPHIIQHHGLRIVLVEMPAFDDTYRSDLEVLRVIASWLTQKYPGGETIRTAGIAYLHRITDKSSRITDKYKPGSVYKHLQMFGRLCGDVPLHRTRLVTTMWDTARDQGATQQWEKELKNEFWKELISEGAEVKRFDNTSASAQNIMDELLALGMDGDRFLLLQEEMVGQGKRLHETEAAKFLYSRDHALLEEERKTLKELANEARIQNDPTLAKSLQEEYEKINEQLEKALKPMEIPLARRIQLGLFGRKFRAVEFD